MNLAGLNRGSENSFGSWSVDWLMIYDLAVTTTFEDGVTTIAANTANFLQDGVLVQTKALGGTGDIFSWGLWSRRTDNQ